MSMENILELQQVSKTFSKSNFALENVTFLCRMVLLWVLSGKTEPEKLQRLAVF